MPTMSAWLNFRALQAPGIEIFFRRSKDTLEMRKRVRLIGHVSTHRFPEIFSAESCRRSPFRGRSISATALLHRLRGCLPQYSQPLHRDLLLAHSKSYLYRVEE